MAYSAPNYNLMSTYINDIADSKMNGKNEMGMDDLLQARYFDRNGLRGSRGELSNQLKDIMAQTDYGRVQPQSRPTIVDKLNEGDPQDKLNDRQYSIESSPRHKQDTDDTYGNQSSVNPYITHSPSSDNHRPISINCKRNHLSRQKYNAGDWSLTKTIVIVIILVGIFYLLLTIMFQDPVKYQTTPGNMNLSRAETVDAVNQ